MNYKSDKFLNTKLVAFIIMSLLIANFVFAKTGDSQPFSQPQKGAANLDKNSLQPQAEVQERYFLGSDVLVKLSLRNSSDKRVRLKDIKAQNFECSLEGVFNEQERSTVIRFNHDASLASVNYVPKESERVPFGLRGITKSVVLEPGEPMTLTFDLTKYLPEKPSVGKYTLTVKFENGQQILHEFEIVFDDEKSSTLLTKMLRSGNDADQNWAFNKLSKFNKVKLIIVLKELQQSNNEKLRQYASSALSEIQAPSKEQ